MKYSSEKYLDIFDRETGELLKEHVANYRIKMIRSGDMLECEIFPIWNTRNEIRHARDKESSEAQQQLNVINGKKLFSRLLHNNFGCGDLHVTLTHDNDRSMSECKKAVTNYLRRVSYYRKKHGLPELKYMAVYEQVKEGSTKKRIHHHIVMNGVEGESGRHDIEKLWKMGYANADRLQPDDFDNGGRRFQRLAKYLMKDPVNSKRWTRSTNLKQPTITSADSKLSKRAVDRIAEEVAIVGKEIFERMFRDYMMVDDARIRLSNWVQGAYIYVTMRRRNPNNRTRSMRAHTRTNNIKQERNTCSNNG